MLGACGRGVRRRLAAEESGRGERQWRKGCVWGTAGLCSKGVCRGRVARASGGGMRGKRASGGGGGGLLRWRAAEACRGDKGVRWCGDGGLGAVVRCAGVGGAVGQGSQ